MDWTHTLKHWSCGLAARRLRDERRRARAARASRCQRERMNEQRTRRTAEQCCAAVSHLEASNSNIKTDPSIIIHELRTLHAQQWQ